MAKFFIIILTTLSFWSFSYGQKLGDYYVSVSMDSTQGGRIRFLNDSIIELSSFPLHMSSLIKHEYAYISTDSTILIFQDKNSKTKKRSEGLNVQDYIHSKVIRLTKIDRGFIDSGRMLIYVRAKDFPKNPDMNFLIGGRFYKQDMGVSDGYGLLKKSPKMNKALRRRLKTVDVDNCIIEIIRGLGAYERFGIDKVYGVIVIHTEKTNYR